MIKTGVSPFKTRTLNLGVLITALFNTTDGSFKIQSNFVDEILEALTDFQLAEGLNPSDYIPMEIVEWGEGFIKVQEKTALSVIKGGAPNATESILSRLATLNDTAIDLFVKNLTDTLMEVYQNANPNN